VNAHFLIGLLLIAFTSAFAQPQIAVLALRADGLPESQTATLSDVLRSEISKTGKFVALERSQMDLILKEQGFQQSGCTDANCAVEVGQLLSVQNMVLGSIGLVGETYTINARLVDVGSGRIIRDITEYQKGKADLLLTETIPAVAQRLCDAEGRAARHAKPLPFIIGGLILAGGGAAAIVLLAPGDADKSAGSTTTLDIPLP